MAYSGGSWAEESVLPFAQGELNEFDRGRLAPALRTARMAQRISLEQISAETRIGLRYLAAIEESRFGAFAGGIYAVGAARAYARAVGLDEAWAATAMREEIARHAPVWRRSASFC